MTAARTLLRELRARGVRVAARGNGIHVEAPTGVVSPEAREQLSAAKPEVLAQLTAENQVMGMSCGEFGRQHLAVELRIPGLDETLWLAPQPADAARLATEGIGRGRIFTAHELADLLSIPALTADEFHKIALLKVAFGADIVEVKPDSDDPTGGNDVAI